jgi:hypothetical protein
MNQTPAARTSRSPIVDSTRARFTLYLVVIVVLPVTVVTAHGWHAVARSTQRQVRSELEQARGSATVAFTALQRHSADLRQRGHPDGVQPRCPLGTVTAGIWMDSQELQRLARGVRLTVSIGAACGQGTGGQVE